MSNNSLLSLFFTNLDDDVFCLINLPEVIKGTLFSRYSRSSKDLRTLFKEEFLTNPDLKKIIAPHLFQLNQTVDIKKAEDFYERILVGYGDDSVAELGGTHLAIENISMLATKSIEEHRIGLSPLEKSTRYVYFDKKINDRYPFYQDKTILKSSFKNEFIKTTNYLFDTYSEIVHKIQPILEKIFPGDDSTAYRFSIRAKACDLARGLLPLSALTNMGVFGNGRAFEYLITTLLNDPLDEVKELAKKMNKNLRQVIPAFVKRATNEKGVAYRQYLAQREEKTTALIKKYLKKSQPQSQVSNNKATLLEAEKDGEEKVIAAILYEKTHLPYQECFKAAKNLTLHQKKEILKASLSLRENRHQKPPRALEQINFSFEIVADWGVYKDLMRNRLLTRFKKPFTNNLGYFIPEEIKLTGFEKTYRQAAEAALNLFSKMEKKLPTKAQYTVIHAAYNRFYLKMNLREAAHLTELRSGPQGHHSYRKIAQQIARQIIKVYPTLGRLALKFVDYNDYQLERLLAFKKLEEKAKKLKVKGFEE